MDDDAYHRGIRDGDREAWNRLAAEYDATLRRQAALILPPDLDPDNAVGDVWMKALEAAAGYDPARSPYAWLARICVRTCLNQRRGELRARHRRRLWARGAMVHEPDEDPGDFGSLRGVLVRLPAREREVVSLRYLFFLSTDEIASLLGKKPPSIRSTLVRGLARLEGLLGGRTADPGRTVEGSS